MLVIASCAGFTSCGDDDDDAGSNALVGTWVGTYDNYGGNYDMIETFFALDTTANAGISEILSVKSEGTYTTVNKGDFSYIQLTPAVKDSAVKDICFLNATDSTLIMLNEELETPTAPDFYTLHAVK